jgi:Leucine-rich repeat (LRR) protein
MNFYNSLFMKKIILASIVFALCTITKTHAQQLEPIPDANLRNALMSKFPECFSGNLLDISCDQVNYVHELNVSNLGITNLSGIQFFKRLQYLKCSNNNLTTLDAVLPDSLITLDCEHNQLTSLPDLPDSLQTLVCSYNKLTALPVLPIKMDLIHCYNNALTQLPDFPNTFSTLWADDNKITSLPPLPDSLRYISLIRNELTTFPAVSTTANKISYINVSSNKITTIPVQASSLEFLEIGDNLITELPVLPSDLLSLGCSKNQITCLPFLPLGLKWLGFRENPITCIPNMPPNLTYFKGPTTIICTAENTTQNNCTYYVPVTGTVYIDYNDNNTQDSDDTGVRDILIYSTKTGAQHTLTDEMGNFTLYLPEGTYIYRANVIDTLFTPPSVR